MSQIPEYAKEYIKKEIRKENFRTLGYNGLTEAELYAYRTFVPSWELYGFDSEWQAKDTFRRFITAERIRVYCRKNKITTKRKSVHCFDGRQMIELWNIVCSSALDNEWETLRWSVRKVDGLKNIYLWF